MAQTDPRKRTASGVVGGPATGQALGGASRQVEKPASGGGAPAASGGGATPAGPPQAAQSPGQVGTGFVNLSQVLAANRPAAQQMGQNLVNSATSKAQQVQADTNAAKNTYAQAGQAAVLQYDPTKVAGAYNQATADYRNQATRPARPQGYGYTEDPEYKAYVDSATAGIAEGKALAETKYTGPKTWEDAGVDVAGLTKRAAEAVDETAALGTAGGRQALLSKQVTGPYSAGNKALDSALLTSAIGGQGAQVAQQYANLSDVLAQARGEASKSYEANAAATADAAGKYGADAAKLEATQKQNRDQLEAFDQQRHLNSDTRIGIDGRPVSGGPQTPYLLPTPKPGGGYGVNPIPGPNGTFPEANTYPAPGVGTPAPANQWGGVPWYMRPRRP